MVFSSPNFLDFKDQNRVFEKMAAFDGTEFTITSLENPQRIHAGRVTADFFTLLRARPMLGRTFLPGENEPGREDRKSTRLNSSHPSISYAVFCLKKKKTQKNHTHRQMYT